ncbi:UNKNOWN [Stylonychia lemnae]|uniref:Uncharacterized protein n=1 Tax=Stylonychia lemnae TaxID=5949 RepID=A0A078A5V7_STYLE|nr:UNKNOWN [Stylonychia lemnae]|eukprot:CDW77286.1 UNKNOWN [Stylonychia lemnae]
MFNDLFCKYQTITTQRQATTTPIPVKQKNGGHTHIWGDYNYDFSFNTQGESLYQTSIVYANAEGSPGLPIPIKCSWFRIKNERTYQIPEISSNVYQLSAEDIGCKIRIEATPQDEDSYQGKAFGEFGPIELDPSARQTLEYVLGTGGSQFPISVLLHGSDTNFHKRGNSRSLKENQYESDELESIEANLYVNSHVIKICFNDSYGGTANEDAIALKYTIDYPRIELHPYDTFRFKIFYTDDKIEAKYDFNKCIEVRALSRQSRDLIALAIKCFSAHTYFINSKIISNTTISAVLLELEFVKRELYNQINFAKDLDKEKQLLKSDMRKMEEEMQITIESYKNILESFEQNDQTDTVKIKKEMVAMQRQIEDLQRDRQRAIDKKIVAEDEQKNLRAKVEEYIRIESSLREEIENISNQMGVPKQEYDKVRQNLHLREKEISDLQRQINGMQNDLRQQLQLVERLNSQQDQLQKERDEIQQYLQMKEDEVAQQRVELRKLVLQLQEQQQMNQQPVIDTAQVQQLEQRIKDLTDENESLLVQRKTLTKNKDSVVKDLEKVKKEFNEMKADYEQNIQRLKQANDRMIEQNNQSELEKDQIIQQKHQLLEKIGHLENQMTVEREQNEKRIQEIEESHTKEGQKKKMGIFAAMLDDDEDSIDIEKVDAECQTYRVETKGINIQTDPIKEPVPAAKKEEKKQEQLPSNRSSRASIDQKSATKQTPLKQSRVANITLDQSFSKNQQNMIVGNNQNPQLAKSVSLQVENAKEKEIENKNKQLSEMQSRIDKMESEMSSWKQERNAEKTQSMKQISDLSMQNQMNLVEKQEKEGCIIRLKELIEDRDFQIENLVKEIERLSGRLCAAESKLFELEA